MLLLILRCFRFFDGMRFSIISQKQTVSYSIYDFSQANQALHLYFITFIIRKCDVVRLRMMQCYEALLRF